MAEGIVKSTNEVNAVLSPPEHTTTTPIADMANSMNGVHFEVYKFFNVNPVESGNVDQLKAINNWAFSNAKNVGEALRKIRSLEIKLGQPKIGETRISKLYNWIRMSGMLKETQNRLKNEIDRIKTKYNLQLQEIRNSHKERLKKINDELARIQKEYKNVSSVLRNKSREEINAIRKEYAKQLEELKSMKSVYTGGK